ncbi:MAG: ABC transporter ATP-binding protein [Hydrogenibacillus sp.]|nr:ABC transporter ATP-binding protein [Hydrogenibacillus sp.]
MNQKLEVTHLTKRIDGVPILSGVSFAAEPGTITGIVGRNGTGKTTLLRTMVGIYTPDGGEVRYGGRNVHADPKARGHFVFVPDARELLSDYTPERFARLFALLYPRFDAEKFWARLRQFELPPNQKVRTYSEGMKGLFYIALAVSTRAEVLLLDEPTEGLDPIFKKQSLRLIVEEVAEQRPIVLICSHRLEELEQIADRILFLKDGTVDSIVDLQSMQERYTKWQVAFQSEDGEAVLAELSSVRILARSGRVYTLLADDRAPADLLDRLRKGGAVLIEPLPLKLEDLFVEKLGGDVHVF